jgi:16S rRNA (guanine(966)-N(2))-methyltransferase RsmD
MRIIAGTKRGMKLLCPTTHETRPITDRVKESLFSILQSYGLLEGARVADLFCGVGSLGLEALSRGAAFVTFVERTPLIADYLEKNIAKAGFVKESRVVTSGAFKVGAPMGQGEARYDLVFVDPPYEATREVGPGSSLARLFEVMVRQVVDRGVAVVRTHETVTLLEEYATFRVIDWRRWGTTSVTLLQAGPHE